jgi:hypothetical protein
MKITIDNGQNVIRSLTDGFLNTLIIYKPLAVHWPAYDGSIGEYYAVSDLSTEERDRLTVNLNTVLIDGGEKELFENIHHFLRLFSNGEYAIKQQSINSNDDSCFHYVIPKDINSNSFYCFIRMTIITFLQDHLIPLIKKE